MAKLDFSRVSEAFRKASRPQEASMAEPPLETKGRVTPVRGSRYLLPLTGVTLPFVSNGGSAMLASWGLLAFLKASDTREKSSFAIRSPAGKEVPVP